MRKAIAFLDILGISSATICIVHCLFFPLLSILPFGLRGNVIIDAIFACIGILVVSKILMTNAEIQVKIILAFSIMIVCVSVLLELVFNVHNELIFIGGLGMIIGHYLNYKSHKK